MSSLDTNTIKILDVDIKSECCANTAIFYKEDLDKYTLVIHLSNNNVYVPINTDVLINLVINGVDFTSYTELYNPNMGCILIDIVSSMFESVGCIDSKYTETMLLSISNLKDIETSDNLIFKIPITILPGSEPHKDNHRRSKLESNYVTSNKHSKSINPKFKDLINYLL